MNLSDILLEVLKKHYKGLTGIPSVDAVMLFCLSIVYIYRGDISFLEWCKIFRKEAYLSIGISILVDVMLLVILYMFMKKKKIRHRKKR